MDRMMEKFKEIASGLWKPRKMIIFCLRFPVLIIGTLVATIIISNVLTLNFAIICMVPDKSHCNATRLNDTGSGNCTKGEFDWSKQLQSTMLSAFSWGALVAVFPFTWMLRRVGLRISLVVAGTVSMVATLLSPLAARFHPIAFIVCRFIAGMAYSSVFPTQAAVTAEWAPLKENGLFMGMISSCTQISPVITMPMSGALCSSSMGWPAIYYVHGGLTAVILVVWILLYRDHAREHSCISVLEAEKITHGKAPKKAEAIPWRSMMTSMPIWACWVATFGNMCGIQFLVYYTPYYLKTVLNFDLRSSGFLSAVPSLVMFVVKFPAGLFSDLIPISRNWSVRIFNSIAFFGLAGLLVGVGFVPVGQPMAAFGLLLAATAILGTHSGGFFKSITLVARQFSPVVMCFVQVITCLVLLCIPFAVAALTPNDSVHEWRLTFIIISAIVVASNVFYLVFASAEAAPWTTHKPMPTEDVTLEKIELPATNAKKNRRDAIL